MNRQAGAILAAIYGEAGWGHNAEVEFIGGLVDSRTGEELANDPTGRYSISAGDASAIDWSDSNRINYSIDWSLYREFAHPALKLDD